MTRRVLFRRGNDVYVESEDPYTGETVAEWERDPIRMCACGRREAGDCRLDKETTFTETYSCGYVYHYTNTHGYSDNTITVKGKRVK